MNTLIKACGIALCLPLTVTANQASLNLELNGLDIDSRIVNTDATRGPDATGIDLVRVTNNTEANVLCQLKPAPNEPNMKSSRAIDIAPGRQATLHLQGSYRDVKSTATLKCSPN
ncbi:hypothetical protein [Pseudomonas saliphila]|uniref:hypothetical protein n=1 Tax=Pseudomonas saliphila TaxID=2586906 RepID=UPI00123A1E19|nr:hypothetical protein [Pseudomonas saliphila]